LIKNLTIFGLFYYHSVIKVLQAYEDGQQEDEDNQNLSLIGTLAIENFETAIKLEISALSFQKFVHNSKK